MSSKQRKVAKKSTSKNDDGTKAINAATRAAKYAQKIELALFMFGNLRYSLGIEEDVDERIRLDGLLVKKLNKIKGGEKKDSTQWKTGWNNFTRTERHVATKEGDKFAIEYMNIIAKYKRLLKDAPDDGGLIYAELQATLESLRNKAMAGKFLPVVEMSEDVEIIDLDDDDDDIDYVKQETVESYDESPLLIEEAASTSRKVSLKTRGTAHDEDVAPTALKQESFDLQDSSLHVVQPSKASPLTNVKEEPCEIDERKAPMAGPSTQNFLATLKKSTPTLNPANTSKQTNALTSSVKSGRSDIDFDVLNSIISEEIKSLVPNIIQKIVNGSPFQDKIKELVRSYVKDEVNEVLSSSDVHEIIEKKIEQIFPFDELILKDIINDVVNDTIRYQEECRRVDQVDLVNDLEMEEPVNSDEQSAPEEVPTQSNVPAQSEKKDQLNIDDAEVLYGDEVGQDLTIRYYDCFKNNVPKMKEKYAKKYYEK